MVDRVGAPYRVLLYQPGIRFIHLSNSKGLCLQQLAPRQQEGFRQQMLWPQVWPRRQEMPQQRATELALIEGVERMNVVIIRNQGQSVTNFIQLVSSQLVDQFSQTKLRWKAPNEGYPHMCRMYKSDNK